MLNYLMPMLGGGLVGHLCVTNYETGTMYLLAVLLGASYSVHERLIKLLENK